MITRSLRSSVTSPITVGLGPKGVGAHRSQDRLGRRGGNRRHQCPFAGQIGNVEAEQFGSRANFGAHRKRALVDFDRPSRGSARTR